ncbi:hypothetical protein H6F43_02225 [Leptolyngbya sp. FACHB-36]|uniref:hypothetical protein n=1 Tax=Leptolyngbya sp. FACHB-36 TaxID=2692808 RepID=UPI0016816E9A|nr:hypothetical protein [Leptolyngbya sp. FACHB-36]MBD2019003.1 hypothetical protein [Leptolyngbya sp. FACHB-36]
MHAINGVSVLCLWDDRTQPNDVTKSLYDVTVPPQKRNLSSQGIDGTAALPLSSQTKVAGVFSHVQPVFPKIQSTLPSAAGHSKG